MYCTKCGNQLQEGATFCHKCGNPVQPGTSAVPLTANPTSAALGVLPASVGQRLGGNLIDIVFRYFIAIVIGVIGGIVDAATSSHSTIWFSCLAMVFYALYPLVCESIWQRTLGKVVTGTKVVDVFGNKPSFMRILGRSFARLIPFDWVSFIISGHPIGWHDQLSGTMVVPKNLTPEEVQKITKKPVNAGALIAVIVVAALVTFAMIGIFSAVILASLNTARQKGNDAAVKSNLDTIKTSAALYYDQQSSSYSGLCTTDPTTAQSLQEASSAGTNDADTTSSVCNDSDTEWAASAPLPEGEYWCADSTGKSEKIHTALTTETACP